MNKIKYFIYALFLLIPLNTFAASISLGCPAEVKAQEEFICIIYGPEHASELSLDINIPDNFVFKSHTNGKNYTSTKNNNNLSFIGNGDHDRIASTIILVAPNISADTNYNIGISNLKYKFYQTDTTYVSDRDILKNILVKGKRIIPTTSTTTINNFVATLDMNGSDDQNETLSCTPNNGKCDINISSITPTREGYTFKGWGLNKDCTTGSTDTYTLESNITMYACWEANATTSVAYLNSLEIEGYEIGFSKFKFDYELNISEDVESLNVNAIPVNSNATVDIIKPDTLIIGENIIKINVRDNGSVSIYTIKVNKGAKDSETNKLASLFVEDYNLNFDPNIYSYNLTINNNTNKLEINVVTENINDTFEIIGNENLTDGSIITINVLGSDGSSTSYTINIKIKNIFVQYQTYFIGLAIVIFMFTVYFIVRHIKQKNGELNPKKDKEKKKNKNKNKESKELKQTEPKQDNSTQIETL